MAQSLILIVEDDAIVAQALESALRDFGYRILGRPAYAEDAVRLAGQQPAPDLVLMDICLKGAMDGIHAAEEIRARLDIPVVYLTAYSDEETLKRAKVTAPYGYILKPINEHELRSVIEMALYRHAMERASREREEWLATTLRSIADGVIAADAQGRVVLMNRTAETLIGCARQDALGRPLEDIFCVMDENDRLPLSDLVRRITRHGASGVPPERLLLRVADGAELRITESSALIRNQKSEVVGVVIAFRDVTDKRKLEEEVAKTQKLESLGLLAGGIAHDFNNILTAILGNISLAKMAVKPADGDLFNLLEEAENASLRAKDLTQQLLTFAKGGAPIKHAASLPDIIRESAAFVLRGSSSVCEYRLPPDLWPVEVDAGQISQVVQNLILNADQAMPDGGKIVIAGENIRYEQTQDLPLPTGRYVKIAFADTGVGIPARHINKIFDPYFTTKQKGSGLGLTTAFSIIKKHGGHITVTSAVSVGTTFNVYLPAAETFVPGQERPETAAAAVVHRGRILVMDDETAILRFAANLLNAVGYEVDTVNDGAAAVGLYREAQTAGKPFRAVILDLTVPGGMGGVEALKRLREADPNVKAIVSSGFSTDPVMAQYSDYGFAGMVTKPYRSEDLLRVLGTVLN
jgi:PAS domain S-box-containing protein